MKTIISFFILSLAITSFSFAQENATTQAPQGKIALEFNFNPAAIFDAGAGTMFQLPSIKGRYFLSSKLAARARLNLGFRSNTNYAGTERNQNFSKSTAFSWSFAPGIEKHFGTGKLVGYIGAELPVGSSSSKQTANVAGIVTVTENGAGDSFGIGANAIFGVDYYLFPNVYIGAEFTPGVIYSKGKEIKVDNTVSGVGNDYVNFNLSSSSGIKVGVRF